MARILIVGVYLSDRPNTAHLTIRRMLESRNHTVIQRWIALGSTTPQPVLPFTVKILHERTPKYALLNHVLEDAQDFDWILACDDDIELPEFFLDKFIELAEQLDFSLCQPARTLDSYIDHPITGQMTGLRGRQTRFVEIGPLTAIRSDAFGLILPFADEEGMGWGLDFIWPALIEKAGKRMGIIDATPVAHRMRPPVANYRHNKASEHMFRMMALNDHLDRNSAFTIVEAYA